jgi:O-antigen ligase
MKTWDLTLFQFLFLILPLSLVTGLMWPNVIITLIVIYYLFKNFSKIFDVPFYFKVFFLFIIYLIFISLIGETVLFSLESAFAYLRYGLFILAFPYIVNKKILKILFYILSIFFLILFFDLIFQFIHKKNIFGMPNLNAERISGMFGKREVAGSYALRLMPILLFLIIIIKKNNFIYKISLIFVSLGIIILSGERTALFLFLLFLFFALLVEKKLIFLISIMLIILIALISINYMMPIQKKRLYDHTLNQIYPKNNEKNFYLFSERHQYHYLTSLNMFKENPFFGAGPNSFRYLCYDKKYSVEKVILEKNTVRAKFDGKIILDHENDYLILYKIFRYSHTDIDIKGFLLKNNQIFETIIIPKRSSLYVLNNSDFKKDDILFTKFIEHKNGCNTHPHNFLIQILGETGLFGFLFYIYFLYKIIFFILKNLYFLYFKNKILKSQKYIYLVFACFINFFPFTASGNFFNSWLCVILSLPLGFLYYLEKNKIH